MNQGYSFVEPDEGLWQQYDRLAVRAFGHHVSDISALREQASARVAIRGGRVVAAGLGLSVPQFFGGKPVPAACLGSGCVAPEERGHRLADQLMVERLRPLREAGAVIATIWTSSNAYTRRLDWQAPVPVFAWTAVTDDLRRAFIADDYQIEPGLTPEACELQRRLAADWNGPVQRPSWWWDWKQAKSALTTYRFNKPGQPISGVLSIATARREPRGMRLVVHDFWAADADAAAAIYGFLGRFHSRADCVEFRRGVLPPYPTLLHGLHRYRINADAWHPWMLRVLDVPAALRRRGWPSDLSFAVVIEVGGVAPAMSCRWLLKVSAGGAEVEQVDAEPEVRFTAGQFAVWYAGGYASPGSARFGGVRADSAEALTRLVRATAHLEPWLPDLF